MDEDVGVFELDDHLLRIRDEIGRQIATVELHALDDVEFGLKALGLFNRDDALVADLLHRLGDHLADGDVAVRRDGADLGDFVRRDDLLGARLNVGDGRDNGNINAALQIHRVHAGGDILGAFLHDGLGQNSGGGGAVASRVVGLRGHFAHHLGAHVLELVLELDLLGDGDAVLGDAGSAEGLVDDDVTTLGAERHLDCVGEDIHAAQHFVAGVRRKADVFGCHDSILQKSVSIRMRKRRAVQPTTPMMSLSFMISSS